MMQFYENSGEEFDADDDETSIERKIAKFIRMKEACQLKNLIRKRANCGRTFISLKNKISVVSASISNQDKSNEELDNTDVDLNANMIDNYQFEPNDDNDSDEDNNNEFRAREKNLERKMKSYNWEKLWNVLVRSLSDLKNDDINEYLAAYTKIIKIHIENKINLSYKCFEVFLNCLNPSYIDQIFNLELVNQFELEHVKDLYEKNLLFSMLSYHFEKNSIKPLQLIMSICVLLYKTKCQKHKIVILDSVNKDLVALIYRNHTDDKFKKIGVKMFIKSMYLNGMFTKESFNDFLSKSSNTTDRQERRRRLEDSDSNMSDDSDIDEDEDDLFDEDDDDDDEMMDDSDYENHRNNLIPYLHNHVHHHHNLHINNDLNRMFNAINNNNQENNNNNMPNPAANQQKKSISEIIDLASDQFVFPMSLKNLCRIAIKDSLAVYSSKNVHKLKILPLVMKNFVLFKEEINSCVNYLNKSASNNQPLVSNSINAP